MFFCANCHADDLAGTNSGDSGAPPLKHDGFMKGRVDAQALLREGERGSGLEEGSWRELSKQRLTDDDVQAGIAAGHWMTDPIAFRRIEEQCLTGVSQRQVASEMSHEQAAIREHKMRGGGAFFRTRVSTSTQAGDIADGD